MAGRKLFVNETDAELYVTLYVRKGGDPRNGNAGEVSFQIPPHGKHEQSYGDDRNIYLNAIKFSWNDEGARLSKEQEVVERGCWWDDVMNTNSIILWHGLGRAQIEGAN